MALLSFHPRFLPALSLLAIGGGQLALQTAGLSGWRGGGMGMYSTHHPNKTVLLFDDQVLELSGACRSERRRLKVWPTSRARDYAHCRSLSNGKFVDGERKSDSKT